MLVRLLQEVLFVAPMKSSTNPSKIERSLSGGMEETFVCGHIFGIFFNMTVSMGCAGKLEFHDISDSFRTRTK